MIDLHRFRPLIPRHIYTRESTDAESGDSLASLVSGIQSLTIKHDTQAEKAKPAQSNHKKSHTLPRPFSKTEGSLSSAPSHLRVSNGETESGPKKIRIVLASPKTWVKDPVDDISKELTSLALHTSGDDNCSETPHRNDSPPQRLEEKQSPAAKGLQAMGPNIQAVNSKEAASESNSGAKDGYSESPASLPLSGASAQIESLQKAESPDEPPEITTNYKPPYKEPAHVSSIEAKVESPTMFIPRPLRSKGNPMAQTPNLSLSAKK